jgi:hypothetical protein
MKQKMTPWFPPEVKPARKGVYERLGVYINCPGYSLWDGQRWRFTMDTPDGAMGYARYETTFPDQPWRGLAEQPK